MCAQILSISSFFLSLSIVHSCLILFSQKHSSIVMDDSRTTTSGSGSGLGLKAKQAMFGSCGLNTQHPR